MHITKEQLNHYISDRMTQIEQMNFLEHISKCEFCAGKLADAMLKKELVFTPPNLKDNILEQTVYKKTTTPVKLPQEIVMARVRKKQREFWMYTAKVAFAVCAAVTMIMMPVGTLPGSSDGNYKESRLSLTKEITEEEARNNVKILDLFRNTSAKISDDVSKALNLYKK